MLGEFGAQVLRIHPAVRVDRQDHQFGVLVVGQPLGRVEHRVVFHGGDHQAASSLVLRTTGSIDALHGEVVRLGTARGEDHLGRARADAAGDRLSGLLQEASGPTTGVVE